MQADPRFKAPNSFNLSLHEKRMHSAFNLLNPCCVFLDTEDLDPSLKAHPVSKSDTEKDNSAFKLNLVSELAPLRRGGGGGGGKVRRCRLNTSG